MIPKQNVGEILFRPFFFKNSVQERTSDPVKIQMLTEPGDLSMLRDDDEVEINYLKMLFQKCIVNENDLDSHELNELIRVRADIDGQSRYTTYVIIMSNKCSYNCLLLMLTAKNILHNYLHEFVASCWLLFSGLASKSVLYIEN